MTDSFQVRSYTMVATSSPAASVAKQDTSQQLALLIAEAADDRKGADIVILNVSEVSYLADYFVLITGFSSVQVRAIAHSIEDKVEEEWQRYPSHTEGQ